MYMYMYMCMYVCIYVFRVLTLWTVQRRLKKMYRRLLVKENNAFIPFSSVSLRHPQFRSCQNRQFLVHFQPSVTLRVKMAGDVFRSTSANARGTTKGTSANIVSNSIAGNFFHWASLPVVASYYTFPIILHYVCFSILWIAVCLWRYMKNVLHGTCGIWIYNNMKYGYCLPEDEVFG